MSLTRRPRGFHCCEKKLSTKSRRFRITDIVALAVPCFVIIVAILVLALHGNERLSARDNRPRRVIHVVHAPQRVSETETPTLPDSDPAWTYAAGWQ
jgi:hypothetical protein